MWDRLGLAVGWGLLAILAIAVCYVAGMLIHNDSEDLAKEEARCPED